LDADHFLRDALFSEAVLEMEIYWHRPVIISETDARMGDAMGHLKVKPNHLEDDVIDNDLILVWGNQKRIITGSDILGRLLRGISSKENKPN
jgi:metal transporter CNNM